MLHLARNFYLQGAEPEDVRQEGMLGLVKGLRDYDPTKGSLRSFLSLTIQRQLITAFKRAARGKHASLTFSARQAVGESGDLIPILDTVPDPRGTVEDAAERRENLRRMTDVLGELSSYERKALEGYVAGETYLEIGTRLARSTKSVDNALSRTRRKIEERLAA